LLAEDPRSGAGGTREATFDGETLDVPVRTRASISEAPEPGPLLLDEYDTTVVVRPGWSVRRDAATQTLVLERE
jgi:N-methylhydantoinase A